MGAWGSGYFESDLACDFWARVRDTNTENPLQEIIDSLETAIRKEEGYLDISDCEAATISSLLVIVFDSKKWFEESFNDKQIPQFYKEEINNFISRNQQQWNNEYKSKLYRVEEEQEDLNISQLAGKALRGNLDPKTSEASDLWSETEYFEEWKSTIQILLDRLEQISTSSK